MIRKGDGHCHGEFALGVQIRIAPRFQERSGCACAGQALFIDNAENFNEEAYELLTRARSLVLVFRAQSKILGPHNFSASAFVFAGMAGRYPRRW
jgi:hypothetical protein